MTTPHQPVVHHAALSSKPALAAARADLHDALRADDGHRRQQYARSALDSAAEVLLDPETTQLERTYAGCYFTEARALIATPTVTGAKFPPRSVPSAGKA